MNKPDFFIKRVLTEAAIGAIGTAAGAAASGLASMGSTALNNQRAYNNWLKQSGIQRAYDMFDRVYNSPKNQMARMQEAGINPNLVANSNMGNTATSHPIAEPPRPHDFEFSGFGNGLSQAISNYITIGNALKTRELQDQQIAESRARQNNYDAMSNLNFAKSAIEYLRYGAYSEGDYFGNLARRTAQQFLNSVYQNGILSENLDFLIKSHPIQLQVLSNNRDFLKARTDNVKADTDLKKQEHTWKENTYEKRYNLLNEQVQRFAHFNNYTDALKDYYRVQAGMITDKINHKYTDKLFDSGLNILESWLSNPLKFKLGGGNSSSGWSIPSPGNPYYSNY